MALLVTAFFAVIWPEFWVLYASLLSTTIS